MGEERRIELDAFAATRDGDTIYLFGKSINLLYKYNIINDNTEVISSIPGRSFSEHELIGKLLNWNNMIILIPYLEKSIWLYDLETNSWTSIELYDSKKYSEISLQAFIYNDILHIMGFAYPYVVRLDLNTRELDYDNRPYCDMEKMMNGSSDGFLHSEHIRHGSKITMGCLRGDYTLTYDLENFDYSINKIPMTMGGVEGIAKIGSLRIMASRKTSDIYILEHDEWKTCCFDKSVRFVYLASIGTGNHIVFLGKQEGASLHLDYSGRLTTEDQAFCFCEKDSEMSIAMSSQNTLCLFGVGNTCPIKAVKCAIDKLTVAKLMRMESLQGDIIIENNTFGLEEFVYSMEMENEDER